MALELGQVERDGIADLASPDLRVPRRRHEHLWRKSDEKRRTEHHGVTRKGGKREVIIMTQIPNFRSDQEFRCDAKRQRGELKSLRRRPLE